MAVGDPHGLALSPDEQTLVCTASGTHELLVFKLPGLPFQDYGGPGDHIDADLLKDRERFYRIPLGGRPMAVRYSQRWQVESTWPITCSTPCRSSMSPAAEIERTIALGGRWNRRPGAAGRGDLLRRRAFARPVVQLP